MHLHQQCWSLPRPMCLQGLEQALRRKTTRKVFVPSHSGICFHARMAQPKQAEGLREAFLPALIFPVRIASMLFESSQAHSPTENSKGHHKLRLGPCHLPPPQPRKRSPYCWPDKGEGSSWFRPQPSMGQVCRARGRFWGACSRRVSFTAQWAAHSPRGKVTFRKPSGGWMEILQPLLAPSPPRPP